jgi:hypothetical protein
MEELKNLSSGISDSAIESGINEIDKIYGEKRNDLAIKREEVAEKVEQQYTPTIGTESDEKKLLEYVRNVLDYTVFLVKNKDKPQPNLLTFKRLLERQESKIKAIQNELKKNGLENHDYYISITRLFDSLSDRSLENLEKVKNELRIIADKLEKDIGESLAVTSGLDLDNLQDVQSDSKNKEEGNSTVENLPIDEDVKPDLETEDIIVSTTAPVIDVKKTVTIDGTNYNVEGQLAEVKNIDSSIGDVGSDSSGYNSAKVVPVGLSVLSDDPQIPRDITPRTDGGRKTRKSKKVKKSNSRKKARKNPRKKSRKNLRRRSRRV